jgi:hypothetical protein
MIGQHVLGRRRPARPGARGSLFYGGVAVLGGLVLAESLFLPWYSLDVTVAGAGVGSSHSAWQAMAAMDVLLLLTAIAAVAGGVAVARRTKLAVIPLAAGVAGTLLSLAGLIDLPDSGLAAVPGDTAAVGREAGPFVALVASAGIAFAGFAARPRPASAAARRHGRYPSSPRRAHPPTAARRSPARGGGR